MTAPNHIIGGIVFTGIFCSFWNVNIFSSPFYLAITVVTSLLPDIDHTRSTIGKIFLPLAKYIDRNFGHRTITHSIIFAIVTYLVVYLFSAFTFTDMNIPLIFVFALSSHLIFDMLTVQGVPLFYPFKRNPCVIPGNPDHRLQGTVSSEFVVFGIFTLMMYFCLPLFENGFWMSYNKNFNSLMHLHRTYRTQENLLKVKFDFTENSNQVKGEGILLYAEEAKAIIYDSARIIQISGKANIKLLQPEKTNHKKHYQTINFHHITVDSLNQLLDNIIVSGEISSDKPFNVYSGNKIESTANLKLKWTINVRITEPENPLLDKLKLKELELQSLQYLYDQELSQFETLFFKKKKISQRLNTNLPDYDQEILLTQLEKIEKEINNYKVDDNKLEQLKNEIIIINVNSEKTQNFTGQIIIICKSLI